VLSLLRAEEVSISRWQEPSIGVMGDYW